MLTPKPFVVAGFSKRHGKVWLPPRKRGGVEWNYDKLKLGYVYSATVFFQSKGKINTVIDIRDMVLFTERKRKVKFPSLSNFFYSFFTWVLM